MPCVALARGKKAGALPPFNDVTDTSPCGRRVITQTGGTDGVVSISFTDNLCLFHLLMKHGQRYIRPPYVDAA